MTLSFHPISFTPADENKQLTPVYANLIQPTKEILEQRLAEFDINDFNIEPSPPLEKEKF